MRERRVLQYYGYIVGNNNSVGVGVLLLRTSGTPGYYVQGFGCCPTMTSAGRAPACCYRQRAAASKGR